ncbi:SIR2 family protein [Phyllobacterium sp. YR620]|uniref:SIR2 family protein n=1 Tax=Phyllobacterium sp. YR620 TaxID=1881066 RepID=UPI0015878DB2|nr:SIR2 family protein [Phyllobacterium sp. YR620]
MARDRGGVVFFCGAGVSQAHAKLDNFINLAKRVIDSLGPALDSPARKLLRSATRIKPIKGVGGFVATDRIFSLLEREFETADVQQAVAAALKPANDVDLTAHRLLLDLAGASTGDIKLVTTNFDRLFEAYNPNIRSVGPADLPNLRRNDVSGVVHLHGRVAPCYSQADHDGLVLSSSDFGRAYLADGWATQFIQSLLSKYQIVFIGYSAEDPPMQYLLEALNVSTFNGKRMYAFQAGEGSTATALWEHKGVEAIAYDPSDGHAALWGTIDAWAERARDVDGWYDRVLTQASVGPKLLEPHVRGQVAHLASTLDGAHRIASAEVSLPAIWLQVMDPQKRYQTPERNYEEDGEGYKDDPFDGLNLDSDDTPAPPDPDLAYNEREIPEGAWDAFRHSPMDGDEGMEGASGWLRGRDASRPGRLAPRILQLVQWLKRIAHEPEALLWALEQKGLHPVARGAINDALNWEHARFSLEVAAGWRWLFRVWDDNRVAPDDQLFAIERQVAQWDWSPDLVRQLVLIFKPKLAIRAALTSEYDGLSTGSHLISLNVEYPRPHTLPEIPARLLPLAVVLFRQHLELAKTLSSEIPGGGGMIYLTTSRADDDAGELNSDTYGITGHIITFQRLMRRLIQLDHNAAISEYSCWPNDDARIFARMRIWAASTTSLLNAEQAANVFLEMTDRVFWGAQHQRDLLFALRDRWNDFSDIDRQNIERKILTTSFPWQPDQDATSTRRYTAAARLDRIRWLSSQGIVFTFDVDTEIDNLLTIVPDRLNLNVESVVRSDAPQMHSIGTDIDPARLIPLPLEDILRSAADAGTMDFEARVQREPFAGLSDERPARALAALSHALKKGDVPAWAWTTFLRTKSREEDSLRLIHVIVERLKQVPTGKFGSLVYPTADWLARMAPRLFKEQPNAIDALWAKLLSACRSAAAADRLRGPDHRWVDEALNSPVGRLVEMLFNDPTLMGLPAGSKLPRMWTRRLESLLNLPGDLSRLALVLASFRVNTLYNVDPEWTTTNVVRFHDDGGNDGNAFWDGMLWRAYLPPPALFQLIKRSMIKRTTIASHRRSQTNILAGMLLFAWAPRRGDRRLLNDMDMREALIHGGNEFATQVLWNLKRLLKEDRSGKRTVVPFFKNVWPRQKALRNPVLSGRLANFALGAGDALPAILPFILPRLVPSESFDSYSLSIRAKDDVIASHPVQVLDVLTALLGTDPGRWPPGVTKILDALSTIEATIGDNRLAILFRRLGRAFPSTKAE